MRVNSIGYDEKYVIYTYFELTRRVICVSNTKLGLLCRYFILILCVGGFDVFRVP